MQAAGGRRQGRPRAKAKARGGGAGEAAFGARLQAAVGGRDVGLGPFHALGKLLYNKRLDPSDAVRACSPQFVFGSEDLLGLGTLMGFMAGVAHKQVEHL